MANDSEIKKRAPKKHYQIRSEQVVRIKTNLARNVNQNIQVSKKKYSLKNFLNFKKKGISYVNDRS